MSDQHSQSVRNEAIDERKRWFSIVSLLILAAILFVFRIQIAGYLLNAFSYLVYSLNIFGRIIPPQGIWIGLLILIVYIAVGSFYGQGSKRQTARVEETQAIGPVEAMADWIKEKDRGVYFKWRIAHLLGNVHQVNVQNSAGRVQPPPQEVEAYLEAGVTRSYVDFPTPGMFKKYEPTVLDIDLEPVLDYLEDQMEIQR